MDWSGTPGDRCKEYIFCGPFAGAFMKVYRNGKVVPALGTWESDGVCEQTAKAGACSSSPGTESHPSGTIKARTGTFETFWSTLPGSSKAKQGTGTFWSLKSKALLWKRKRKVALKLAEDTRSNRLRLQWAILMSRATVNNTFF